MFGNILFHGLEHVIRPLGLGEPRAERAPRRTAASVHIRTVWEQSPTWPTLASDRAACAPVVW